MGGAMGVYCGWIMPARQRDENSLIMEHAGVLKGAKVACLFRKSAQAGLSCVGWSGARVGRTEVVLAPDHPTREGI
jgi:hypothetical protein